MRSAVLAIGDPVPEWVKRLLTWLSPWFDQEADRRQHQHVIAVTDRAIASASRADRAVAAYHREQATLRRRRS